jgi:Helix-turn-helix of DDE superfamily endonuclease
VLSYPAAIPLSTRTLTRLAELIRRHRAQRRSRWYRLDSGRQALLVLAHLRNGDTYARLADGFRIGTSTADLRLTHPPPQRLSRPDTQPRRHRRESPPSPTRNSAAPRPPSAQRAHAAPADTASFPTSLDPSQDRKSLQDPGRFTGVVKAPRWQGSGQVPETSLVSPSFSCYFNGDRFL